ncbi:MAG TPA: DNA-primase RepB domain-containing protein [Terriglobales bacterium]|nr:DNA-primase RepB domain-containing protein [Terriglobales bacterium]
MLGSMLDIESLTQQAIRRQLAAMPNKLYLIRLIHSVERKPAPAKRLWTAEELARDRVVHSLRGDNRLGFNVYLWPYAEGRNAGYILLDLDHARPHVLEDMRIHGHEPCVVLETSPGHLQAWVRVSTTPLEPALATTLGRILAERYGGDRASTDWRHLGRLAGFSNLKPATWRSWVLRLRSTLSMLSGSWPLTSDFRNFERVLGTGSSSRDRSRRPYLDLLFSRPAPLGQS